MPSNLSDQKESRESKQEYGPELLHSLATPIVYTSPLYFIRIIFKHTENWNDFIVNIQT